MLSESVNLCRSFKGVFGEVLGEQRLAQIETAIDQFDAGSKRLSRALAKARESDSPMVRAHSLGRIYSTLSLNRYEAGDLTNATRYLARGLATQRVVGECAGCDVLLYPAAVPIYIAQGELQLAAQACTKAEETASAFGSRSWLATARYLIGLLAGAQADWPSAVAHLEEAACIFDELGQPYDLARTLERLALSRANIRGTEPHEIEEPLSRAVQLYRELGALAKAEKAQSLLRRGELPSPAANKN